MSDGFTRGFVRTVAGALGLDADDAVTRLLAEPAPEEALDARPHGLGRIAALAGALVVALAAAVLAVWGLRAVLQSGTEASPPPELLLRRDAVRALAESVGQRPAGEATRAEPTESTEASAAGARSEP